MSKISEMTENILVPTELPRRARAFDFTKYKAVEWFLFGTSTALAVAEQMDKWYATSRENNPRGKVLNVDMMQGQQILYTFLYRACCLEDEDQFAALNRLEPDGRTRLQRLFK